MFITRSPRPVPRVRRHLSLFALTILLLSVFAAPASPLAPRRASAAPAPGQSELLIPTVGTTPGGVWHFTADGWVLHSAGLPQGWVWRGIVADPRNADHWFLWAIAAVSPSAPTTMP